jgi:hypothetical protein
MPEGDHAGIAAEEVPRKPQHGEDRDDRQHVLVIRISNDARQYDVSATDSGDETHGGELDPLHA